MIALLLNLPYFYEQARYGVEEITKPTEETNTLPRSASFGPANTISIPKIGVTAPIIYVNTKTEAAYQDAMSRGVGHYPGSANPGEIGNVFIFGHSAGPLWRGKNPYLKIFSLIPKLEKGDSVFVSDSRGRVFEYRVFDGFPVKPNDVYVTSQETNGRRLLTLQTSWPLGTSLGRYVIRAELVQ